MPSSLTLRARDRTWQIVGASKSGAIANPDGFDQMPLTSKGDSCGCLTVETNKQVSVSTAVCLSSAAKIVGIDINRSLFAVTQRLLRRALDARSGSRRVARRQRRSSRRCSLHEAVRGQLR
jgi:hypothetical protein